MNKQKLFIFSGKGKKNREKMRQKYKNTKKISNK